MDFRNTVVIMTSNVGSQQIAGFSGRTDSGAYEAMKRQVTDQLRGVFRPEFLNRVDEVIVFHSLTDADLAAIVGLLVGDLARRIAANDLTLELTPAALAVIRREGTDPAFGARPLKRTIQRLVENPFARAMLAGTFHPGDTVVVDADPVAGTLVFSATSGGSVVANPGERRDARAAGGPADDASAGGPDPQGMMAEAERGDAPTLDLPILDRDRKRKPDGGLVN